ncbi:hypothetical protein GAY28_34070 [Azospirillum brasilense]|uniref:Uncharacterized protein n=1 Tax=Azospirillum formosense TaxID=861533 RepID=A0ABX2KX65_9PROT|nr:hypothetical protein [Azospirillum formosense]MBY3757723.1 hypothetical protein [Azospirillum formosense]NUB16990.1 hypothetical protein [Azospirillum brasilense]NUB21221.1 hypothetical protein [Azospirillum formosense]
MFIETHVPFGLFRPLWNWLTRRLLEPTYRTAHDWHLESLRFRRQWDSLGAGISYSLHLENAVFSNRERPVSVMAVRNTTDRPLTDVEILVTARSATTEYQERHRFDRLFEKDKVVSLPSIPLKTLFIDEDGIRTPYSEVEIRLVSVVDDGRTMTWPSWVQVVRPTYTEWFNSHHVHRWEQWWNTDLIELKKEDLKIWLRYVLVTRHEYAPFILGECHKPAWFHELLLRIGRPVAGVVCRPAVVSALFWMPILLRLRRLPDKLE